MSEISDNGRGGKMFDTSTRERNNTRSRECLGRGFSKDDDVDKTPKPLRTNLGSRRADGNREQTNSA